MANINLADIKIGMVVAGEVKNMNGQLLLKPGTEISQRHISIMESWGITEVDIEGIDRKDITAQAAAVMDPEILAKAETLTRELFLHADQEHPMTQELFTQCILRKAHQLK